jgi:hypothetical protein
VTLAVSSSSSIRAPEGGNPQNPLNYSKKRHQGMKRILGIGVEVDCSDRVGSVEGKATFSPSHRHLRPGSPDRPTGLPAL